MRQADAVLAHHALKLLGDGQWHIGEWVVNTGIGTRQSDGDLFNRLLIGMT